jgi:hypothetical protein
LDDPGGDLDRRDEPGGKALPNTLQQRQEHVLQERQRRLERLHQLLARSERLLAEPGEGLTDRPLQHPFDHLEHGGKSGAYGTDGLRRQADRATYLRAERLDELQLEQGDLLVELDDLHVELLHVGRGQAAGLLADLSHVLGDRPLLEQRAELGGTTAEERAGKLRLLGLVVQPRQVSMHQVDQPGDVVRVAGQLRRLDAKLAERELGGVGLPLRLPLECLLKLRGGRREAHPERPGRQVVLGLGDDRELHRLALAHARLAVQPVSILSDLRRLLI